MNVFFLCFPLLLESKHDNDRVFWRVIFQKGKSYFYLVLQLITIYLPTLIILIRINFENMVTFAILNKTNTTMLTTIVCCENELSKRTSKWLPQSNSYLTKSSTISSWDERIRTRVLLLQPWLVAVAVAVAIITVLQW